MTIRMFEKKSVVIDVGVETDEVAKDISGGVVRAVLISPGGSKKNLTATITDATGGVIRVLIPKATVDTDGKWLAECALKLGTDDRTVWQEDVLAARSYT